MNCYDSVIIGGGLAGLTAALHLQKAGYGVLVIEKGKYPRHKVCGEYISNEVRPYLEHLDVNFGDMGAVAINTLQLSTQKGKTIQVPLPLGGVGVSRYALDGFLQQKAMAKGVQFVADTVVDVTFARDRFALVTQSKKRLRAKVVLGAYGKRSNLDMRLQRQFTQKKSPWLGVKCHYDHDGFPSDTVALHGFPGGYGGLSKTENGAVNFCYLTSYNSFKREKDIKSFNENVVSKNPFLKRFLQRASPRFEKPLSIAQISFQKKSPIQNHMLMLGDSAGLIHPLCGNGMAMAIHSGKLAAECSISFFGEGMAYREKLERDYQKLWILHFKNRLFMGRQLQRLLLHRSLSEVALATIAKSERVLQHLILATHGKPIVV
ncbi:MAG: NAD(P)/FAD-dependent oxidoreductase [Bacteroidota bacterium]